jgi:hypothetical protein
MTHNNVIRHDIEVLHRRRYRKRPTVYNSPVVFEIAEAHQIRSITIRIIECARMRQTKIVANLSDQRNQLLAMNTDYLGNDKVFE